MDIMQTTDVELGYVLLILHSTGYISRDYSVEPPDMKLDRLSVMDAHSLRAEGIQGIALCELNGSLWICKFIRFLKPDDGKALKDYIRWELNDNYSGKINGGCDE